MNRTNLLLAVILIVLAGLATYVFISGSENKKFAFIELNKVFLEFQMKKELEANLKVVQDKRQALLDSLKLELQVLSRKIESEKGKNPDRLALFTIKRDSYYEKEKQFGDDNLSTAKMFDEQIFTQLNQYVKDYGKEKNYMVILGAEGSGSLMYAEEAINITNEVKNYINQRYAGRGTK